MPISVQNLPQRNSAAARRKVVREKFEFDTLRAPFSVGHGQFVLHNAAIEGPLVSATMLGKLDFRTRVMQVGGTFTPLSTLNKMFSEMPLVGDIVTGPKREGVFAMTYALQGGLENPELVVNPFSAITPGITRELMQITPSDPRIVPRKPPTGKNEKGAALFQFARHRASVEGSAGWLVVRAGPEPLSTRTVCKRQASARSGNAALPRSDDCF